jgi:uroporphyrinogen-III synthase
VRALKEVGLAPTLVADVPTTEGVIAKLRGEDLRGRAVGVQLYGVPNPALETFLSSVGATVRTVLPYVYAPAADAQRVVDLIQRMAAGTVDAICFTSSPQLDRLYEVAAEHKVEPLLQQGLKLVRVAVVGPIVADRLREHGRQPDICPEQGFVMKNLVQHIKRELGRP